MDFEQIKKEFPIGCPVVTKFYKQEKAKIRKVKDVYIPPYPCQSGVMILTECGINADARWFRRVWM